MDIARTFNAKHEFMQTTIDGWMGVTTKVTYL